MAPDAAAQELEEEMESQKQAWLKKQRSARDRSRGAQSKEVQALNKQLQAALQVLDVERYHAAACEEAAMAADRHMHRFHLSTYGTDLVLLCCRRQV